MVISDIDGCITNNMHRSHLIPTDRDHTPNWSDFNKSCMADSPVLQVIDFVKHLADTHNSKITFLTSRGEDSRSETIAQLNVFFDDVEFDLHMRPMNDHRCTIEYKHDVIERLSPKFNQHSVIIDDHPGIIKMCADKFPGLNRLLVKSYDCTIA